MDGATTLATIGRASPRSSLAVPYLVLGRPWAIERTFRCAKLHHCAHMHSQAPASGISSLAPPVIQTTHTWVVGVPCTRRNKAPSWRPYALSSSRMWHIKPRATEGSDSPLAYQTTRSGRNGEKGIGWQNARWSEVCCNDVPILIELPNLAL